MNIFKQLSFGAMLMTQIWGSGLAQAATCADTSCAFAERIKNVSGFYAKGDYSSVIAEFALVQGELRPEEKFYLGMAHFGLFGQTRSKALQCQYRENSQDLLKLYLSDQRTQYQTIGTYGSDEEIREVYAATRVMEELNKVDGCLENGLTTSGLRLATQQYVGDMLDRILMQAQPNDSLLTDPERQVYKKGQDVWSTIQKLTRQFVDKSSNIESEISKKFVEYDASRYNIDQIKGDLGFFGQVSADAKGTIALTPGANDGITKVETDLNRTLLQINNENTQNMGYQQKFQDALSGMTPENYDKKRKEIIGTAQNTVVRLAWAQAQVTDLMLDDNSPVKKVQNLASGSAAGVAQQMRTMWQEYGKQDTKCSTEVLWYCQKRTTP